MDAEPPQNETGGNEGSSPPEAERSIHGKCFLIKQTNADWMKLEKSVSTASPIQDWGLLCHGQQGKCVLRHLLRLSKVERSIKHYSANSSDALHLQPQQSTRNTLFPVKMSHCRSKMHVVIDF